MKTTMDYMIGNAAIQIINTGKKIKVIDVKKKKVRQNILKHFAVAATVTLLLITSCFYVVHLENEKVILDKQLYALQSQVDDIAKENVGLRKQELEVPIDYDEIFARAKEMGMNFPTNKQIGSYEVDKSTAVRISDEYLAETR